MPSLTQSLDPRGSQNNIDTAGSHQNRLERGGEGPLESHRRRSQNRSRMNRTRRRLEDRKRKTCKKETTVACCDWQTFEDSFLTAWRRKSAGEALIDWGRAHRDWKRYHCTGGESASMQLRSLANEGIYLWFEKIKPRKGNDGEGGVCVSREPVFS